MGAPLAFPGAAGMVAESRGLPQPSGRKAGGGGAAAAPSPERRPGGGGPASSLLAQPGGPARDPRRHGRGSRGVAAAGGGPQQGEALAALGFRAGRPRRPSGPHAPSPGPRCPPSAWSGALPRDPGRGRTLRLCGTQLSHGEPGGARETHLAWLRRNSEPPPPLQKFWGDAAQAEVGPVSPATSLSAQCAAAGLVIL